MNFALQIYTTTLIIRLYLVYKLQRVRHFYVNCPVRLWVRANQIYFVYIFISQVHISNISTKRSHTLYIKSQKAIQNKYNMHQLARSSNFKVVHKICNRNDHRYKKILSFWSQLKTKKKTKSVTTFSCFRKSSPWTECRRKYSCVFNHLQREVN